MHKAMAAKKDNIVRMSDYVIETDRREIIGAVPEKQVERMKRVFERFTKTDHSDIFLEEPETNLFPPTQCQLVDLLIKMATSEHRDNFFIATHSPYVMNRLLEQELKDFSLFLAHKNSGKTIVRKATANEVQEIYDNNVDSFFNIETYR